MKKLLAVMALIVVVFTIGAVVVNAEGPSWGEKFQECHEFCSQTNTSAQLFTDYVDCLDLCMIMSK